jgi:hypothetical protein
VRPGGRYRVACYVKSNQLVTPEGPRIVVTDKSGNWIAASDPIAGGTNDWKPVSFEFVVPPNVAPAAASVYVSVKRRPKYSYDEPTKGTIWVDDFRIDAE